MMNITELNNRGYSLMEVLVVLAVISTILLICFPMLTRGTVTNQPDHFFEQLEKDLYEAQLTAMSDGVVIRVVFSPTPGEYTIRDGTNILIRRPLPNRMTVMNGSLNLNGIRYNTNGNLAATGTIIFHYKRETYKLVLQFVRGRFYIEKL